MIDLARIDWRDGIWIRFFKTNTELASRRHLLFAPTGFGAAFTTTTEKQHVEIHFSTIRNSGVDLVNIARTVGVSNNRGANPRPRAQDQGRSDKRRDVFH